jgi:hypothetical protein
LLDGDKTIVTAILDLLLHASHVLNIAGRSYRRRDLDDRPVHPNRPVQPRGSRRLTDIREPFTISVAR